MREAPRRDGAVTLYGEDGDQDMVVVEAVVMSFVPARGNASCICGAPLEPWGLRCVAADEIELGCTRCHRVHGHIRLSTRVLR